MTFFQILFYLQNVRSPHDVEVKALKYDIAPSVIYGKYDLQS